jgi:hypothetical protein
MTLKNEQAEYAEEKPRNCNRCIRGSINVLSLYIMRTMKNKLPGNTPSWGYPRSSITCPCQDNGTALQEHLNDAVTAGLFEESVKVLHFSAMVGLEFRNKSYDLLPDLEIFDPFEWFGASQIKIDFYKDKYADVYRG